MRAGYTSVGIGPMWVQRFDEEGLKRPDDRPCCEWRPTHSPEARYALISLALQKPQLLRHLSK